MRIILTNGSNSYIRCSDTGATRGVPNIDEATIFESMDDAIKVMKNAPGRTKGYYYVNTDVETDKEEEHLDIKKPKRKQYSSDVRRLIYHHANGKCELCGKRIKYEDMTLDHIKPLSMGGVDEVENLQCSCYPCNQFKGNILPEDFIQRISEIFMYQMEKKHGSYAKNQILDIVYKSSGR